MWSDADNGAAISIAAVGASAGAAGAAAVAKRPGVEAVLLRFLSLVMLLVLHHYPQPQVQAAI